jgi:hypothetical protein
MLWRDILEEHNHVFPSVCTSLSRDTEYSVKLGLYQHMGVRPEESKRIKGENSDIQQCDARGHLSFEKIVKICTNKRMLQRTVIRKKNNQHPYLCLEMPNREEKNEEKREER